MKSIKYFQIKTMSKIKNDKVLGLHKYYELKLDY